MLRQFIMYLIIYLKRAKCVAKCVNVNLMKMFYSVALKYSENREK